MMRKLRRYTVLLLLAILPAVVSPAQESATFADMIRQTGAHKISGFVTLGLATATAATAFLSEDAHEPLGYATAAMSVVTVTLGSIAYLDYFSVAWPHIVLNAIGTTAFLLNAFALEGGSVAHIASGITGLVSMLGALGAIIIIMS